MSGPEKGIASPVAFAAFRETIAALVGQEAAAFFGKRPAGLLLIVDDPESLRQGKFRQRSSSCATSCANTAGRWKLRFPPRSAGMVKS